MRIKLIRVSALLGLLGGVWLCVTGAAAPARTLAILPLTVHAEKDMGYLSRGAADILASRISAGTGMTVLDMRQVEAAVTESGQPVSRVTAGKIGQSLKADYIVYGSITRLGDRFSLDVTVLDIAGEKAPSSFFGQAADDNDLIPAIGGLAEKINQDFFAGSPSDQAVSSPGIKAGPSVLQPPPADASPVAPAAQASGPRLSNPTPASGSTAAASPLVAARPAEAQNEFWKSPDLAIEGCGLAVADLDADGKNEVVIAFPDGLHVGRIDGSRLDNVSKYQAKSNDRLIAVDAADTDRDGRAEIFVTCTKNTTQRLCSFVLSLSGNQLETIAENQNWYFRSPGKDRVFGQKRGLSEIFMPGVWRLEKNGADYVEKEEVSLPDPFSVFSFYPGDIDHDGISDLVIMDNDDRIRIYDQNNRLAWKTGDYFGGGETRLTDGKDRKDDSVGEQVFLPQRVVVCDINADGRNEILTVLNKTVGGRVFERFRRYNQASFSCLSWDGLGLSEIWHTNPVSGYAADFSLADIDNDGQNEIAALMVTSRGSVISSPRSALIFYETENSPK